MVSRGFVYTLEVLIAIFIIATATVSLFLQTPEKPQGDVSIIKRLGIETLEFMDSRGTLRSYAAAGSSENIENELDSLLPVVIASNATVCSNVCSFTGLPKDRNVIVTDYYISGYRDEYLGKKVRIFMWVK